MKDAEPRRAPRRPAPGAPRGSAPETTDNDNSGWVEEDPAARDAAAQAMEGSVHSHAPAYRKIEQSRKRTPSGVVS